MPNLTHRFKKNQYSKNISPSLKRLLHDRERMLSTLMSNLKGMVYCCLLDDDWTMVFVSDGCLSLTGFSTEDLLFNRVVSYENLTFADDRQWVRELILNAANSHQHFELEYRLTHANGDICWVHESGLPLFNEEGELLALEGFIQDITARKLSEQLALNAELRYLFGDNYYVRYDDNYLDRLTDTEDNSEFHFYRELTLAWKTYHSTSREFIYEQTSTRTKPSQCSSAGITI